MQSSGPGSDAKSSSPQKTWSERSSYAGIVVSIISVISVEVILRNLCSGTQQTTSKEGDVSYKILDSSVFFLYLEGLQ